MPKPIVAIVGRPNVGKSMLFNKITGSRLSIVEDTPGVTRDRLYADAEWRGRAFSLIDTGGIEPQTDDDMLKFMRLQAEIAIEHADVILFVTDITAGLTASDSDVAGMLIRARKPVVLCVNKVDTPGRPPAELYEFYNLGLGDPIPVSAIHGHSSGDLLDAVMAHFPPEGDEQEAADTIKVAVVGRPNVGKSSLLNRVLGEERVIVSNIPGTTRDSVDANFNNKYGDFTFIDTAGIRRKSKVYDNIEHYSVLRALLAMDRSDVCVVLIDGADGIVEQDVKIAGLANEKGKGVVIAVNKWDIIEKDGKTMQQMRERIQMDLAFMSYAPIVFISAMTGGRLGTMFEKIVTAREQNNARITTGILNELLADATARVQPPTDKGKRLKIYYMTQVSTAPPTFVMFCNNAKLFHYSYKRYIENQLRASFGFEGTDIRLIVRERDE